MADPAPSTDPQQPPSAPAPTPNSVPPQQTQPDLDEKKFSQREYNAFEANIKRQYQNRSERDKELIEKGKQFEAAEAENQPLAERVSTLSTQQAETARERDEALKQAKVYKMAAEAQLDPVLWDRVRGNTDDEIAADIETLKPLSSNGTTPPAGTQQPGGPAPNRQQGTPSQNDGKTGSVADGRSLFKQRAGVTTPSDDAD
jgi:histone deacetylase complex regulatory component SIN3